MKDIDARSQPCGTITRAFALRASHGLVVPQSQSLHQKRTTRHLSPAVALPRGTLHRSYSSAAHWLPLLPARR